MLPLASYIHNLYNFFWAAGQFLAICDPNFMSDCPESHPDLYLSSNHRSQSQTWAESLWSLSLCWSLELCCLPRGGSQRSDGWPGYSGSCSSLNWTLRSCLLVPSVQGRPGSGSPLLMAIPSVAGSVLGLCLLWQGYEGASRCQVLPGWEGRCVSVGTDGLACPAVHPETVVDWVAA